MEDSFVHPAADFDRERRLAVGDKINLLGRQVGNPTMEGKVLGCLLTGGISNSIRSRGADCLSFRNGKATR